MDCPFCGKEMKEGKIPSGIKWVEDETWEGVPLRGGLFQDGVKAFFCPDCRQIVAPVPEVENLLDKTRRVLGAAGEKIGTARKELEARRAEKEKETKKKKSKGKDPWEL